MTFSLSLVFSTALLTSLTFPTLAHADDNTIGKTAPSKVSTAFSAVYAPVGFDSNDNVQIVGEGMFANTCYRPADTGVQVDQEKKTIMLTPMAYHYDGVCLQVLIPFERVVDLGILRPGHYTVYQNGKTTPLEVIRVERARTRNPDDFLYAPISQAFYRQSGASVEITLTGQLLSDCMHLDEVKVGVQPRVIVLQPLASMENRGHCSSDNVPFSKTITIGNVKKGRYLVHVRSMNAKAVNTVIDVD